MWVYIYTVPENSHTGLDQGLLRSIYRLQHCPGAIIWGKKKEYGNYK